MHMHLNNENYFIARFRELQWNSEEFLKILFTLISIFLKLANYAIKRFYTYEIALNIKCHKFQ